MNVASTAHFAAAIPARESAVTFADLFSGIGGFHSAVHSLGGKCVFACENDPFARTTYEHNFKSISPDLFTTGNFAHDITKVDASNIPDFDLLCAGFPCQPFSQAGFKKGFNEARGTLFFHIARIIDKKRPKAFLLENVRHFASHEGGRTLETVKNILERDLGYSFSAKVVKASDFGLPQHRPRLFMVGFRDGSNFDFPTPIPLKLSMTDIFGARCNKTVGYTLRVGGRGSGLGDRRNWDTYLVDGKETRIGPKEGLKLQGFPETFNFPVSETQAMKQLGNSVAVPAVRAIAEKIIERIENVQQDA